MTRISLVINMNRKQLKNKREAFLDAFGATAAIASAFLITILFISIIYPAGYRAGRQQGQIPPTPKFSNATTRIFYSAHGSCQGWCNPVMITVNQTTDCINGVFSVSQYCNSNSCQWVINNRFPEYQEEEIAINQFNATLEELCLTS